VAIRHGLNDRKNARIVSVAVAGFDAGFVASVARASGKPVISGVLIAAFWPQGHQAIFRYDPEKRINGGYSYGRKPS